MSSRFSRLAAHSAKCARTIGLFLACGLMAHAGTEKALAAQPAAAPAEAARQLKIPFAPPTGRELAYDVTITKSGARTNLGIAVGTTAPAGPAVGDLWVDTN